LPPEQNPKCDLCDDAYDEEHDEGNTAIRESNAKYVAYGGEYEQKQDVLKHSRHISALNFLRRHHLSRSQPLQVTFGSSWQ